MTAPQLIKDRLALLSIAAVALGVILIVLAETVHWEWTKAFGAGAITAGGLGLGVEFGLTGSRNWQIVERIKALRLPVSYIMIAVLTVPMVAALLAGVVGMFGDLGDSGALAAIGGALMVLFMIVASIVAIAMTVSAIQRAFRPAPVGSAAEDTREQPREGED